MASRKQREAPRNDADAVFDRLFADTEGWDARVAAATTSILIAEQIYALRARHGLSQRALAALINSSQSAIARMEDATYTGHSISVLNRIAAAVGEQVIVRFVPPADADVVPRRTRRSRSVFTNVVPPMKRVGARKDRKRETEPS
jgi:DNA-binding XRE family transcriptional regulator